MAKTDIPKAPMGHVFGGNPNSRGEDFYGHVNVTPPRLVGADQRELFNEEQITRRSGARGKGIPASNGGRGGNPDVGGR